tara:strand:+ start:5808 stop:8291 length:2484 start_codon:yes stop_codon:yes gene_type:complete
VNLKNFLLSLTLLLPIAAQAQSITPAQMQQFKSLPKAQQVALARQYGVDLDAVSGFDDSSSAQGQAIRNPTPVVTPVESGKDKQLKESEVETTGSSAENDTKTNRLEPFGYDLFAGSPTTFAPVTAIPVPAEYSIGPGDEVRLQLWGKQNQQLSLTVGRDGTINLPDIGPEPVVGLTFAELKERIATLINEHFIGVKASVSLGELRSMRVFVLGEARNPGAYTVSSLSTITNALFVSGGISKTGSLRNIQLKRNGKAVSGLDLYNLLLKGDSSNDARLQPGDVIFIPPVGQLVGIKGEVRRPALYELKNQQTLGDLLALAGGFTANAYPKRAQLQRVDDSFNLTLKDLDLSAQKDKTLNLKAGDVLTVSSITDQTEGFVNLAGEAVRPGRYAWREGLRISDLISSLTYGTTRNADYSYALHVREHKDQNQIAVTAFSPRKALEQKDPAHNLLLASRDRIILLSETSAEARQQAMQSIVSQLQQQTGPNQWAPIVRIGGAVRFPGSYPMPEGGTLKELLDAAGGLKENALMLEGEVTRYTTTKRGTGETRLLTFTPSRVLEGGENMSLQGRDQVLIKSVPDFASTNSIALAGEVRYPGEYTFAPGDTLKDVILRAGGLTENAFPRGAVFTREKLRQLEAQRLQEAQDRLKGDLLGVQLQGNDFQGSNGERSQQLQGLLKDVQDAKPVGRMVLDLSAVLGDERYPDILLKSGDRLTVPEIPQAVTVFGEVQFPTSHLHSAGLTVDDYLKRSGGPTRQADESRVYVVKADGSVMLPEKSAWFGGRSQQLQPGDTVIMPIDVDRLNQLELWTNVSQIVYQMALGAAAVGNL